MADVHAVARDQLRAFIERIERLEEEKKSIADDIKDVYGEAKGTGFDTKVLRKLISIRKQDRDERAEQEAILDMYMIALGMVDEPAGYDEPRQSDPVERQPAMALRSDAGLNIVTKHTEIAASPETATELSRPATSAVSGGEPSKPSSDVGGVKMDGCNHPGRPDAVSGMHITQSEQATNSNPQSDDGAIAEVKGRDRLANADGVEPPSSVQVETPSDEREEAGNLADGRRTAANTGGIDVARSATRAGLADPTSNTGEGAASALPTKSKLRPHCQRPGNTCGGYGDKHCHDCLRAMREYEAA